MGEQPGSEPGEGDRGVHPRLADTRRLLDAAERLVIQSPELAPTFRAGFLARLRSILPQLTDTTSDAALAVVHATFSDALRSLTRHLGRRGGDPVN